MNKNNWIFGIIAGATLTLAGYYSNSFLWPFCLFVVLIYIEWRLTKLQKLIETKEKIMGNRLIEGIKTLSDICGNAFDYIKDHKLKLEKFNAKLGENTAAIYRLNQQKHRVVANGNTERRNVQESTQTERTIGKSRTPKENNRRPIRERNGTPRDVPNPTDRPKQGDGQ